MNNTGIPILTPIIHPVISKFLSDSANIGNLIDKYGSPLNLLFPELVKENTESYKDYFSRSGISGSIFFAHKANRSFGLLQEIADFGVGIEVSSLDELNSALKAGVTSEKIIANGPKNNQYLAKALEVGCLICTDSLTELSEVLKIKGKHNILIRFSDFADSGAEVRSFHSRFGITYEKEEEVLKSIHNNQENINILGLSFHLDSTSDLEKQIALKSLLRLTVKWLESGVQIKIIDIGGGFRINYVEDKNQWDSLLSAIQSSVISDDGYLWNHHNFGYYMANGRIRGEGSFYPYYSQVYGTKQLDNILNSSIPELSTTAIELIWDLMLDIYIEPGRGLLDQVGITLLKISQVEQTTNYYKVIVDGNYKHLTADQDIMVDPILVTKAKRDLNPSQTFIFGNLCLENDVIFRRQILLPFEPKTGDFLAFINTAAYKMDFSESKFIHHKLPQRLIVKDDADGFNITTDLEN